MSAKRATTCSRSPSSASSRTETPAARAAASATWTAPSWSVTAVTTLRSVTVSMLLIRSGVVMVGPHQRRAAGSSIAPGPAAPRPGRAAAPYAGGSSSTRTCSSSACAPPPTAPSPSSVGVPTPAVKLPSDAPPTAAPVSAGWPRRAAIAEARAKSAADERGLQRRPVRPAEHLDDRAPGSTGRRARSARSTRSCSASGADADVDGERARGRARCWSWCPTSRAVGVTVVPAAGSARAATASTWWASSTVALTPRSGSSPACAARPVTRTS